MPIRPSEKARYPKDWKAVSARIRVRSGWRCECAGECGLHRTHPGPRRCTERHGEFAAWARGVVVLTTAHLNHQPEDNRDENLKAMCLSRYFGLHHSEVSRIARHLRYDKQHHAMTRRAAKNNQELFP